MVRLTKALVIEIALLVLGEGVGYGVEFADVPRPLNQDRTIWYANDLYRLADLGAISGYQSASGGVNFSPEKLMKRAEFLKLCLYVLSRGPNLTASPAFPAPEQAPFPDVPINTWYVGYVAFAKQWGITEAGRIRFDPDVSVTRREAVGFIMRTLDLNGGARDSRQPRTFTDSADPEVVDAYSARIVEGNRDGLFYPNRFLSRAEAVTLVARALRNLEDEPLPIRFEMTAYTLDNLPLRQIPVECPCPNFGIRLNRPEGTRNLIRVSLHGDPPTGGGTYYALHRSNSRIKVWSSDDRSSPAYLGENDTYRFEFGAAEDVFVENVSSGESVLSFELRRYSDDGVISRIAIGFKTLDLLVVVLGGWHQDPGKYNPDNPLACSEYACGIFAIGDELYKIGYDIWLFNQEDVDTDGHGKTYDFIRQAITQRGVNRLAILGYSWGGGATYDLTAALTGASDLGEFEIVYTAYIDAIRTAINYFEDRRPPGSEFHLGFSQIKSCRDDPIAGLCGTLVFSDNGLITVNVPVNNQEWGTELTHFSIDDSPSVSTMIVSTLKERVQP